MPTITPIPYHVPSGIKTYKDRQDWRSQHPAGNIPVDPNSISRFWSDPQATRQASGGIPGFPQIGDMNSSRGYLIPARDSEGRLIRCKINSSQFYDSYARTMAHNSMVATMQQYAWVYELTGDPVVLTTIFLTNTQAMTANFSKEIPNYPIELRSDHVYFTLNDSLVCLSTGDFIEYFKPQGASSLAEKRATVLALAADTRLSDAAAISMIRLAIEDDPTQVLI